MGQIARCFYYSRRRHQVQNQGHRTSGIDVHCPYLCQRHRRHCSLDKFSCVCASKSSAHGDDARPPLASWEDRNLSVPFGGSSHRLGDINEPVQRPLAQIVNTLNSLIRRREVQIGSFPTHVLVAEITSPVPGQRQAETGDGLVNPLLAWFSEAACEPQTTGSTSAAPTP